MTATLPEAFYLPAPPALEGAETFTPTDATRSVWSTDMQHGAPPSALLVRALERCAPAPGTRLTRVVTELLGPIPVTATTVRARVVRPGRAIALLQAEMLCAGPDGDLRPVATATAWRLATTDTAAVAQDRDPALPPVPTDPVPFGDQWSTGTLTFLNAVEWQAVRATDADGPGVMWARPLLALVAGEQPSPLQTMFSVVDAANGVGATVDPVHHTFLNTDLTVHIHREPAGDWVGLSAEASIGPDGIGTCAAVIHDADGPVGRSAQTLLVRPTGA